MPKQPPKSVKPSIKPNASLKELQEAAKDCRACDLWRHATQTVFGEGPPNAKIILVGEQPGDQEDREGKPFVGPAGRLLDGALAEAGIDRKKVYVTNAVKPFKWEPRGKSRIHKKPNAAEIAACRLWLDAEMAALHPKIIVCLGATAAPISAGPRLSSHATSRRLSEVPARANRDGDRTSLIHSARARRANQARGNETLHRRPQEDRQGAGLKIAQYGPPYRCSRLTPRIWRIW